MKIVYAAAMTLMLVAPAYAQSKSPTMEEMMGGKTPDQIEKEQAADKAYKESLKKIPNAKAPADPWGGVRSDAPKETAKTTAPAKPKTKTGSTVN